MSHKKDNIHFLQFLTMEKVAYIYIYILINIMFFVGLLSVLKIFYTAKNLQIMANFMFGP